MLTDIEIAQAAKLKKIAVIAEELGIHVDEIEPYGHYKAKILQACIDRLADRPNGRLILVTAVNPTPAGEGKTTTSIGLAQGLCKLGKRAVLALREPSLGPVFGVKGGAAGGGYSQVLPMEDINLHFTGDLHAVTSANNLLSALLDNHIHQGNALGIDPRRVFVRRCIDMNDRALRNVVIGLGGKPDGVPRQDGFIITVASEVMAILCLAEDLTDLKARLGGMIAAYSYNNTPVYARDLNAEGAMAALLKHAINPNLAQTIENTPAIIHGGPFANIAHGCNSVRATKLALKFGDYAVTEAGFGSDLGAEKFFDIKCRTAGLTPECAVLVVTARALKYNGGAAKTELAKENMPALKNGIVNLRTHVENLKKFGVPVVAAVNKFMTDSVDELEFIRDYCVDMGIKAAFSEVFEKGGDGGVELAKAVCEAAEDAYPKSKPISGSPSASESIQISGCGGDMPTAGFKPLYDLNIPVKEKLAVIAKEIYRADDVHYSTAAERAIRDIESHGFGNLPVCVAKTQYSLSDDPAKLGAPRGFVITVRDLKLSAGAGFIVAMTGDITTMPGLPKAPSADSIDIDADGNISGLF